MLIELLSAATTGLGTYNVARWVVRTGIEKRRQAAALRSTLKAARAAVDFGKGVYTKVHDGTLDPKAIADYVASHIEAKAEANPEVVKAIVQRVLADVKKVRATATSE